jgi:Lon-like protease
LRLRLPHPLTVFAGVGIVAAATALLLVWNPSFVAPKEYVFLPDTAHPLTPVVRVQGATRAPGAGSLFWVDVLERRATWIDRLFAPDGATFVPENRLLTPGESESQLARENAEDMENSQQTAAYVALREAGYTAPGPPGIFVLDVSTQAPAGGRLLPADEILAVDGKPIRKLPDVRRLIGRKPVGASHVFTVLRGVPQALRRVKVPTIRGRGGFPIVGIVAGRAPRLKVPSALRIGIDAGAVGGPSAGLAFTLQLLQELGRTIAKGYRVAATGTIAMDGRVGAIGGIKQKTIGARRAHIDVFLVPVDGDNAKEAKRYAGGMRVIPVTTFQQALRALATIPQKG